MQFVNGRQRVGCDAGSGNGPEREAAFTRKKSQVRLKKTEKGLWVMKHIAIGILGAAALGLVASAASAATLDDVKAKGFIQCGVSTGLAGFSAPDDKGDWQGIDADFCRAVAAAVFGDGTKVKFTPLSAKERFTALQSGEIDVLSRNTTWTINRDTRAWSELRRCHLL